MLFVFKELILESYFVVSHSALLILIRLEKYMFSLQEVYVSVGISSVRNDWNWTVWNGNFSYSWHLKDDSFLSHVHSHYLSELTVWFTSIASKMESLTPFRPLPPISFACCSSLYQKPALPSSACLTDHSWISTMIFFFLILPKSWCMSYENLEYEE